jgi:Uma2 family endonuclease
LRLRKTPENAEISARGLWPDSLANALLPCIDRAPGSRASFAPPNGLAFPVTCPVTIADAARSSFPPKGITVPHTALPYETVGELLEQLGRIDPRRVRLSPPPGKATEKDVLALLDHENRLYELVDGVLVEKIMGLKESALAADLVGRVSPFVREHDLGIVAGADGTLRLLPRLIRIPDLSFISWDQLPSREYPVQPIPDLYPDLAVEVLSAGNTVQEIERKLKEYFLAGTRLVWIIDPDARIVHVYTSPDDWTILEETDTLTGGEILPGFKLPLRQLFARLPRAASGRKTANEKQPAKRGGRGNGKRKRR